MTTLEQPSNEELLRKVIEAQVNGGCSKFSFLNFPETTVDEFGAVRIDARGVKAERISVIEILLDTEGCKAAYGYDVVCDVCGLHDCSFQSRTREACERRLTSRRYIHVMHKILDSWSHSEGNNLRAALLTAVSFLPQ